MPFLRPRKQKLFAPPYDLLPLAIWAFFVVCVSLHPASPLRTHELLDTDDYMRLNEVVNWLQSAHPFGAGWFDLSHPRLNPGENPIVHWARLVDLPIAFVAYPFIHGLGVQNAVLTASFIVPPLLFGLLLMLIPMAARPLIGRSRANLAAVMVLFAPAVLMNFLPGRVDHHGYQIIIAVLGLGALSRCILCPRGWIAALAAAIAFACGLWIGTEALPWVMLFVAGLAVLSSWRGGFALRNAAVFGMALPAAIAAIMPVALRPAEFSSRALSWFSGADLVFGGLAGAALIGGWLGGRLIGKAWLRFALMAGLGTLSAILLLYLVPDFLTGAYADYDTFFNETLIANIGEAQPLAPALVPHKYIPETYAKALIVFLHTLFLPLLGAGVIGWKIMSGTRRMRVVWLIQGLFLVPAVLLALFWQIRVSWFMQIFCIAPVTWFMWHMWSRIGRRFYGRSRFWAEICAFILVAPLPVILLPSIAGNSPIYPDVLLFAAEHAAPVCPLVQAAEFLDDVYGKHPRVILSGTNEGPELLFRTPHSVLAAPYNVDGNRDSYDFFNARDERQALRVVHEHHVDLVLVCRIIPPFYANLDTFKARFNAAFAIDKTGHLHMQSSRDHPTLIERLGNGNAPAWLKPITIPFDQKYLLFEVKSD